MQTYPLVELEVCIFFGFSVFLWIENNSKSKEGKTMNRLKNRKSLAFFLLCISIAGIGKAQGFGDGQQWNVLLTQNQNSFGVRFTVVFEASEYDDDSLFYDGYYYKPLMAIEDDFCYCYGLFRHSLGKTHFRKDVGYKEFGEEFLLYDWTLLEGDTVFVQTGSEANGLVVNTIDDTIINGLPRRIFTLSYLANSDLKEKWIEGIGSELGFPFSGTRIRQASYLGFEAESELLCYHKSEELIWQNSNYDTCLINFEDINEHAYEHKIQACPNPTDGYAELHFIDKLKRRISIFDSFGRIVKSYNCESDVQQIDLTSSSKGIYYIFVSGIENMYSIRILKR